jgi:hypothetical protein
MTIYYRVSDGEFRDITAEQYAELSANKQADLRLYVVDAQPTPSASQVVVNAGIVVGPVEAHLTWDLRDKTVDELEADALDAELAQLDTLIASVETQNEVTNSAFNAMTTAQKFDVLRADRNHILRAARFLLRRARRGMP